MSGLEAVLTVYGVGVLIEAVIGVLLLMSDDRDQKRDGAQLLFLAVVWPYVAFLAAWSGVKYLWELADWKG